MKFFNHKSIRIIHFCLSIFFIPFILMYIGTGIMYISGFNQNAGAKVSTFEVNKVLTQQDISEIKAIMKEKGIDIKNERIVNARGSSSTFSIIYSPRYEVAVTTKDDSTSIKLIQRRFWGIMLLMHVSKAGIIMNIFAVMTSISIMIVYLSGFIMTSWSKNFRKYTITSFLAGIIVFALIYISL